MSILIALVLWLCSVILMKSVNPLISGISIVALVCMRINVITRYENLAKLVLLENPLCETKYNVQVREVAVNYRVIGLSATREATGQVVIKEIVFNALDE